MSWTTLIRILNLPSFEIEILLTARLRATITLRLKACSLSKMKLPGGSSLMGLAGPNQEVSLSFFAE
jgi:hypothetical protein